MPLDNLRLGLAYSFYITNLNLGLRVVCTIVHAGSRGAPTRLIVVARNLSLMASSTGATRNLDIFAVKGTS